MLQHLVRSEMERVKWHQLLMCCCFIVIMMHVLEIEFLLRHNQPFGSLLHHTKCVSFQPNHLCSQFGLRHHNECFLFVICDMKLCTNVLKAFSFLVQTKLFFILKLHSPASTVLRVFWESCDSFEETLMAAANGNTRRFKQLKHSL